MKKVQAVQRQCFICNQQYYCDGRTNKACPGCQRSRIEIVSRTTGLTIFDMPRCEPDKVWFSYYVNVTRNRVIVKVNGREIVDYANGALVYAEPVDTLSMKEKVL